MSTQKEIATYILEKLQRDNRVAVKAMFGEYAVYVDGKVVGLICDDQLYVKIAPASEALQSLCEQGSPYPGAKPQYIVDEKVIDTLVELPEICIAVADTLPAPKKKKK